MKNDDPRLTALERRINDILHEFEVEHECEIDLMRYDNRNFTTQRVTILLKESP